nr:formyltransferase family protein [Spirochaetota bacterium]
MANIAIFASGNGSNFEEIAKEFIKDNKNSIKILIYDRKKAFVTQRSEKYGINSKYINYFQLGKETAEKEIIETLKQNDVDVIFLAGFMRILSGDFIDKVGVPIINIHPSLLPKYKGENGI